MAKRSQADKPSPTFTSWKLDILNAACVDSRLTASQFRMLARVLKGLNEDKLVTILSDDVLADEVPGFKAQSSAFRARKAIAALGYWTYVEGSGRRGTRYFISDAPVNAIEDELIIKREARTERRARRRDDTERGMKTLARLHDLAGKNPCDPARRTPASSQAVHLKDTPSGLSLRVEDMAQDTHARGIDDDLGCVECGKPSVFRCEETGHSYCAKHRHLAGHG